MSRAFHFFSLSPFLTLFLSLSSTMPVTHATDMLSPDMNSLLTPSSVISMPLAVSINPERETATFNIERVDILDNKPLKELQALV